MKVIPVACLSDNYAYLLVTPGTKEAVVVDPSEAEPVVRALESEGLVPVAIWNTHHHPDHTGGNEALVARYGLTSVSGHVSDKGRIAGQTRFLEAGATFKVGSLDVKVLHIPGHTLGAIAYVVREGDETDLFTGDTMFHGGCGRLFEGTAAQMDASLKNLVAEGAGARVYPGHEYTVQNLRFAASVEPSNAAVTHALRAAEAQRNAGKPTVGTTIALEQETNPFVRTRVAEIRKSVGVEASADDATALAAIREAKNAFR